MNKTIIIVLVLVVLLIAILAIYFLMANPNQNMGQGPFSNSNSYEIQGMKVEILKQGNGAAVKNGDRAMVHYTGTLENGTKFDSSIERNAPFTFTLGESRVIKGWDLGVVGMKVGE